MAATDDDVEPFTVRTFTPADQPQVDRLICEGLLPGHVALRPDEVERLKPHLGSEREGFWVAEADGQLIGSIAVVEEGPDVGHVYWLRVAPEWQADFAVARRLAQTAATHAAEVGLLKLISQVPREAEDRVVAYYQKMGFEFALRPRRRGAARAGVLPRPVRPAGPPRGGVIGSAEKRG